MFWAEPENLHFSQALRDAAGPVAALGTSSHRGRSALVIHPLVLPPGRWENGRREAVSLETGASDVTSAPRQAKPQPPLTPVAFTAPGTWRVLEINLVRGFLDVALNSRGSNREAWSEPPQDCCRSQVEPLSPS